MKTAIFLLLLIISIVLGGFVGLAAGIKERFDRIEAILKQDAP